jgi:hypothetical protein
MPQQRAVRGEFARKAFWRLAMMSGRSGNDGAVVTQVV